MNFSLFDNFTVNFKTIFKSKVSKKLYLYVCIRINGIKGIFMETFNYSSSQKMKLNKVVDLRRKNYKAGNTRSVRGVPQGALMRPKSLY